MSDNTKSPVSVILVILMLSGLLLSAAGFYLLKKEKDNNLALQERIEDLNIKLNISEKKLDDSKKKITQLEAILKEAQDNIDALNDDLEVEKGVKEEALSRAEQIRSDFEKEQELKSNLEAKVLKMQEDMDKMQLQLKELKAQKAKLDKKIKELQEQQSQNVELGTIEVNPQGGLPESSEIGAAPNYKGAMTPTAPLEGVVLVVNREYNFAVISLGGRDGVEAGDVFVIYHNDKEIGEVKVEKVHDSMSAADFVSQRTKEQISEGDRAAEKVK